MSKLDDSLADEGLIKSDEWAVNYYAERGWISVPRRLFEERDPCFRGDFQKIGAFLWIVAEATHQPYQRLVNGHLFDLRRGQVVISVSLLAQRMYGCEDAGSRSGAQRFLKRLAKFGWIATRRPIKARNAPQVISIRNYQFFSGATVDEHRKFHDADETQAETQAETRSETQPETTTITSQHQGPHTYKNTNESPASQVSIHDDYEDDMPEFD